MAMEVGAAAAAATGVGAGLWSYNRGNYMFDQKNHYTRFTAGLNMAIAQTGLYRQDIQQLTELTVARQDCYHGIAAMGLTILTAIYCPGRVGLHEPPPPGWLQGLEFVNIAGCYLFLGLALWYAMHASMRADTAATHMLTRFVRLPIPSQGQLDQARKFLSSYEEQPLKEIFRVPFTKHSKPSSGSKGGFNEAMDIDDAAKARSRHGHDVPAWYKKEREIDFSHENETIGTMMPLDAQGTAPEHFEAYRELQMEWFPYDVYARISIFLAFLHLCHCWAYLQIGYLLQEVRAVFACAIVMLPMFVLMQVILTLDIFPKGIPVHRLGPFALWFAYFGAICEYVRWYDPTVQKFGFILVYVAYALEIIYTISLFLLCRPSDEAPAVAETPGAAWWPGEWRLPTAFAHATWLVAPPKELREGDVDIVGELREATNSKKGRASDAERRADVHNALGKQGESPAWFGVKIGLICLLISWIWLTVGFTIEVMTQGTAHPSLLSAPGTPNQARDPRYRPAKPGKSEPTEVGTGGVLAGPAVGVHSRAVERRLAGLKRLQFAGDAKTISERLREMMPVLQDLADFGSGAFEASQAPLDINSVATATTWPSLFEPETLACGADEGAIAVTRHGRAARVAFGSDAATVSEPFALSGLLGHGAVLSAAIDREGLLVVTADGAVFGCAATQKVSGRWSCKEVAHHLPLEAGAKVSIGRDSKKALQVAVFFEGEDTIALFDQTTKGMWRLHGEVRAPEAVTSLTLAPEAKSLLATTASGGATRFNLADGSSTTLEEPALRSGALERHAWGGACELSSGDILRLATPAGADARAELIIN
mmetsp:Transcript_92069/g.192500  ORF Transcript_92069/g.192500 Transcript_92069/m.192500 type:complete len:824 (-) Transcript_92069:242-2713(-)